MTCWRIVAGTTRDCNRSLGEGRGISRNRGLDLYLQVLEERGLAQLQARSNVGGLVVLRTLLMC